MEHTVLIFLGAWTTEPMLMNVIHSCETLGTT